MIDPWRCVPLGFRAERRRSVIAAHSAKDAAPAAIGPAEGDIRRSGAVEPPELVRQPVVAPVEKGQVLGKIKISYDGKVLAEIGVLSSAVLKEFSIGQAVYYADVDWEALMREVRKQKVEYQEISKYPAVSRDLALLLDKNVSFAQIVQIAKQTEKKLLQRVELFDVYEGKNLPEGKKSYAVNFILQDAEKTLNDKAIDAIMQKLIKQLTTQLGAELR